MKLFTVLYFMTLGYLIRATHTDEWLAEQAGELVEHVATIWTIRANEVRKQIEARSE